MSDAELFEALRSLVDAAEAMLRRPATRSVREELDAKVLTASRLLAKVPRGSTYHILAMLTTASLAVRSDPLDDETCDALLKAVGLALDLLDTKERPTLPPPRLTNQEPSLRIDGAPWAGRQADGSSPRGSWTSRVHRPTNLRES